MMSTSTKPQPANPQATQSGATTAGKRLPSPDERPGTAVVIYDGHCRICTTQVRKLPWWDAGERLSYLSLHDPRVAERYPDLTHEQLMRDMYLVDPQGNRHRGAEAIRYLSRRLPRLWFAAPLLHIPLSMPLWQWLYRQIADRRYKFGMTEEGCEDGACAVHLKK